MAEDNGDNKRLLARRAALKGNLTRMLGRVSTGTLDDASLQMLILLEEKTLTTYSEYESINIDLGELAEDPAATENTYIDCLAGLRSRLAKLARQADLSPSPASSTTSLKLPQVEMPPFDGKYSEYKPFIEMFTAFIDKDKNLSDIQKFFYLRSFLKLKPTGPSSRMLHSGCLPLQ